MKKVFEYVLLTIGSIIVAGSLELILAPNGLVDGGVTAIAIMANKVAGLPLYGVFLGINIPILLFTAKVMGKKFFIRTSYANVVTTLGLIYLKPFPAITTSELLIVLYGGVLFGIGVGIVVKMLFVNEEVMLDVPTGKRNEIVKAGQLVADQTQ